MNDADSVVIPIESVEDSEVKEWAMIEVNGELLPPKDKEAAADHELVELGSLNYGKKGPRMVIGTHELEGKLEDLKQPYCIMQKENGEYKIRGIVKQKILFNQYPKTIMR